jgi:predicted deacylase
LLTITNRGSVEEIKERSAIVISARVHPGESNSSFIMHGLIKFLTSQDSAAVSLRNNFVFKIVPMLNPDGVIHGNYRCSMMGTDLNRRYKDVHPLFYPTISSLKSILKSTHEDRCVLLFLDIHGHSKKKNAFIYGCDVTLQSGNISRTSAVSLSNEEKMMQKIYTRIFPTILSSFCNKDGGGGYFSSIDNSYKVQKSKKGTARVVGIS